MIELDIVDVGGDPGVVFSESMLSRLGVQAGDEVVLLKIDTGYLLTSGKQYSRMEDLPVDT